MNRVFRIAGLVGAHTLFWGWNLLFLSIVAFGIGPVLLFETLQAAWMGIIPWSIAIFVPILISIPALGMVVGGWKLRHDPGRLLSLFFGVEFPLMVLVMVRIFGLGQLVWSTTILVVAFFIGALCLVRTLISGFSEERNSAQIARLVGQSAYLWIGMWICAFLGIYLIPTALEIGEELLRWPSYRTSFATFALEALFRAFALFTVAVFLTFPVAMIGITLRAWQVVHRESIPKIGLRPAWAWSVGTIVTLTVATAIASHQPQRRAIELLDAATDEAGQREAIANEALIRRGLLNMRLSGYRYLGHHSSDHVRQMYRRSLGAWPGTAAAAVWSVAAWPVTYHPVSANSIWQETNDASRRYLEFFDVPMDRAEREVIKDVMRTTWNWRQAAAGLLDIGEERVWLESQEIDVTPHGDHATVTIHDVYRNRTWQNEEVLVSFSLPEDAVVTGLWLGSMDDQQEAFKHVVAPRGAAQEVYERQVRRSVDPALLEQVGPRQYRLRAFPVLPREGDIDELAGMADDGPPLHVWIQVDVWGTENGWPLPQSTEVRNLFWNRATTWTVNGETIWDPSDWTPEFVADSSAVVRPVATYAPTSGPKQISVFVDTSRSMATVEDELYDAIAELEGLDQHEITWVNLDDRDDILLWGNRQLEDELWTVSVNHRTDALVVITDSSSYDVTGLTRRSFESAPLWMVHLGGLPHAYSDPVLDAITQTNGGIGESVSEVIRSIERGPGLHDYTLPHADSSVERLAAKDKITAHIRNNGTLDEVHELAVEHDLVTPWSSMIVLVNAEQLKQLEDASNAEDRFEREAIDGNSPFGTPLTSTPEPHEWVLMALAALMLGVRRRSRRAV